MRNSEEIFDSHKKERKLGERKIQHRIKSGSSLAFACAIFWVPAKGCLDASFTEILNKEDSEQLFSRKSSVNWILIFHKRVD